MPPVTGTRYGRLVLIGRLARHKHLFQCDCGQKTTGQLSDVLYGRKLSCGCLRKERATIHGHSGKAKSREYSSWMSMKGRCLNKSNTAYPWYGGRGIQVYKRWLTFENFLADMGAAPSQVHTIERLNSDGNYEPGNCRWATRKEQALNRRTNRLVEYNGKRQTVSEWVTLLKLDDELVRSRLKLGWSFQDAVDRERGFVSTYNGQSFKDIRGSIFGFLTVLHRTRTVKKRAMWLCRCACGTTKEVSGKDLRSGHTSSCGCQRGRPGKPKTKYK